MKMTRWWWLVCCCCLMIPASGSTRETEGGALDALLHRYASTGTRRTGVVYQVELPTISDLGGIRASALRLRSGSLRKRGFSTFHEFRLPPGTQVHPPVERLLLVYQNLGNSSSAYYPLPPNYIFLSPVLGLLAYEYHHDADAATKELQLAASLHRPISIAFPDSIRKSVPHAWVAKCASLGHPSKFTTFFSNNTCAVFQQGHFALVAHSPDPDPLGVGVGSNSHKKITRIGWLIPGVGGGVVLLFLASMLLVCLFVSKRRERRMDRMERAAECGETLHMTKVGTTKAPAAPFTRTLPTIESEYS